MGWGVGLLWGGFGLQRVNIVLPGRLSQLPPSSFAMLATLLDPHSARSAANLACPSAIRAARRGICDGGVEQTRRRVRREYPPVNGTAGVAQRSERMDQAPLRCRHRSGKGEYHCRSMVRARVCFYAPFIATPESKAGARPVILLPNPFYSMLRGGDPVLRCRACVRARRCGEWFSSRLCVATQERVGAHGRLSISVRRPTPKAQSRAKPIGGRCLRFLLTNTTSSCSRTSVTPTSISTHRRSVPPHRARGAVTKETAHLSFAVEAIGPAGFALRHRRGQCQADGDVPCVPQLRGAAGADADPGRVGRVLERRRPCRRQPRHLWRKIRTRAPHARQPRWLSRA